MFHRADSASASIRIPAVPCIRPCRRDRLNCARMAPRIAHTKMIHGGIARTYCGRGTVLRIVSRASSTGSSGIQLRQMNPQKASAVSFHETLQIRPGIFLSNARRIDHPHNKIHGPFKSASNASKTAPGTGGLDNSNSPISAPSNARQSRVTNPPTTAILHRRDQNITNARPQPI